MKNFDVFNGDADGICALLQLRQAAPLDAELLTGVKRDIQLLDRVDPKVADRICVLVSIPSSPVLAQTALAGSGSAEAVGVVAQDVAAMININTATAAELASQLNGIGGSKAEAIVRYREQFGPFESVDELSEVAGIGESTVERNRGVLSTQ